MTSRCAPCNINYPYAAWKTCDVCDAKTTPLTNGDADPDWKEQVNRMLGLEDAPKDDKVTAWRFAEASRAGLSPADAEYVASHREIDLEALRRIAKAAGPEMAMEILK